MSAYSNAEASLAWWDEELPLRRAALARRPANADLIHEVEAAEKMRERAYVKASEAYDRQCEDDYAAQWASEAFGPDVNPTGARCG